MRPYLKAKHKLFILIAVFLCCCKLFSQEAQEKLYYEKNFSAFSSYFLENYGIACKEPENMSILTYNVIWTPRNPLNDSKRTTAYVYGPVFQSEDKECILAYPITNIYFRPLILIISEIKSGLGTFDIRSHNYTSTFEFNNYVSTITGKAVRETFYIDTLYIYDIPNADSSYFTDEELEIIRKENYPYCTGLVLCKEGRIATVIKLFLSEKGKLKEDEYIKMLSKLIRYSDTFE